MKLEFSPQIFEKHSNIKFHKNPSNGSLAVPCGRTTAMTKLVVAFRNIKKAPKRCAPRHYQFHSQFKGPELSCVPQLPTNSVQATSDITSEVTVTNGAIFVRYVDKNIY
jgi:hypothetical protein